ncbi:2-dehydropantoate 2-reductase [Flavisphingomonas formosensis]|uniref:2-dehydropantoate 2-reductase n=1 Tax=Flavisphingomonas formosensis TaxID=861534 RepID=UPI0012F76938|nr:2-dehydropantoate 2-reductase [Sphingomonas formosensis]
MKVGIVGAGAIGTWLGVRLARSGHSVSVLARGATLDALRAGPWRLDIDGETVVASVAAAAQATDLGRQDLLVLALKGPALGTVAPLLAPMIGPDTIICPAMNGVPWWFMLGGGGELAGMALHSVDPDGSIERALPFDSVIGSVVHASVAICAPAHAVHKAGNRLILGEPDGAPSARLASLADAFTAAGFDIESSPHVRKDIWYKLWGDMTMNPISAFTGATCDRLLDDPLVADFVLGVMAEAQEIGARIGCPIAEHGRDRMAVTRQLGAFKTSMLQDVEAGRPIEIDQLLSAPRELAECLGIATPNLDLLTGLTRLFARSHGLYPGCNAF